MSANVLSVTELRKAFGPRVILDGVTFGLDSGDTIGLIGDNGAGKSTFLKIIAGLEPADGGVVAQRNDVTLALLDQVPTLDPEKTIRQILEEPFGPAIAAVAKYEALATAMDPEAERWLAEVERLDGWDWMHRLERVASQCNVGELDVPAGQLSGGQQKRVALARLILLEPDIILFDEPTNHLDATTVEWLEQWIAKTSAACMVVTHDRYFLENVVTKMAEIRDGQLKVYEGSYSDYLLARAEEEAQADRVGHRRLQMLKSELDWARRSPKARTTKSKSRLQRVDALQDDVTSGQQLKAARGGASFEMGEGRRLGKTILEFVNVTKGFDGPPLIEDFS
ncbi:MAG: ATP-binding cassette subfamily F protein uup, partial [Myxococcota bacterium]